MIDTRHLSSALTERFGLEVEATTFVENDGQKVIIRPRGIERTISFKVEILLGWRTVSAVFIPGNYASGLVAGMKGATPSQLTAFSVFSESLESKGARVSLQLDSSLVDTTAPSSWPQDWKTINISMKKVGVVVEKPSGYDFNTTFPWATAFFGLALSLLPLEKIDESLLEGEKEGAVQLKLIKQYERSRINRAACIEIHGSACKICGFDFGDRFGDFGEGFIHIHHIVPLSEMGHSYVLDPSKDLIPVCPNCHAMLHRRRPALSPEELLQILVNK